MCWAARGSTDAQAAPAKSGRSRWLFGKVPNREPLAGQKTGSVRRKNSSATSESAALRADADQEYPRARSLESREQLNSDKHTGTSAWSAR